MQNNSGGVTQEVFSHVAVLGQFMLTPGAAQEARVSGASDTCVVEHFYALKFIDKDHGLDLDIADCTLFKIFHPRDRPLDLSTPAGAAVLFSEAVEAINEVLLFHKVFDRVGKNSAFSHRIGVIGVKYFIAPNPNGKLMFWSNPRYMFAQGALAMMQGLISSMLPRAIMANGPVGNPLPENVRRVSAVVDLLSLGFHTEAFISMFALVDDLVQEVLKAGLAQRGIEGKGQREILRAIKEDRLRHFVTTVCQLCGWTDMEKSHPDVFAGLIRANKARNDIMHGSGRVDAASSVGHIDCLLAVYQWLQTNPFGYAIAGLPSLAVAGPEFSLVDVVGEGEGGADAASS